MLRPIDFKRGNYGLNCSDPRHGPPDMEPEMLKNIQRNKDGQIAREELCDTEEACQDKHRRTTARV